MLARGDRVVLARGGLVTPLAQDTLNERRVTVVREGEVSADEADVAPRADIRTVALASDHTGITMRAGVAAFLRGRGVSVRDLGTESTEPVDYPDVAQSVADCVVQGDADAGIVIDAAGIGSAMAANKVNGVRAAVGTSETVARYSREHNGANVLTLGATLLSQGEAQAIVGVWIETRMREPRYIRRLLKIRDIERQQHSEMSRGRRSAE